MMEPVDFDALVESLRTRIGTRAAPTSRTVEPGALVKFARATGQTDPLYLDPANGPVAPPTYLSTFCADTLDGVIDTDLPLSNFLHTDDAVTMGEPIRGGDTIRTGSELVEVFVKHGKRGPMVFQTAEITLTNQHDRHVATLRVTATNFT